MTKSVGYRVRLRVRLAKALNTTVISRSITVAGREVSVLSQKTDQPLSEALWIVFRATGFSTEQVAREFGERLRTVVEIAGLCSRLGIDVGNDQPTSWVSEEMARSLGLLKPHETVAPNVHGLAILPDDDSIRIPILDIDAKVRADPEQLLNAISETAVGIPLEFSGVAHGIRILNQALINTQPLAQIALCLSAVEALGQTEKWTDTQVGLIAGLAAELESRAPGNAEYIEVAEVLRRGLHRISLRQGVMRVLTALGLQHLRKEWDRIYAARSGIFHGTLILTESEIAQLALDAMTLCGRVILAVAEKKGAALPSITSMHFPNE